MALPKFRAPSHKKSKKEFLVSACLAGIRCTYNGRDNLDKSVKRLVDKGRAIPVCPEVLGGLPIPRSRSEIAGGAGSDVLLKNARVMTISGDDVSGNFIRGIKKIINIAKKYKITKAILKSNSPSCGSGKIYDGTFKQVLRKGDGILTAALKNNGVKVYERG